MPEEVVSPETMDNPLPGGTNEGQDKGETAEATGTRFDGKTPEELRQIASEQDKQIGRLGSEVGKIRDLEQKIEFLRGALESRQQFVPEAPTPPQVPPAEFDFTDPRKSVSQIIDEKLGSFQREIARREAESYVKSARYNMERGRQAAMEKNKTLFEGIEGEVTQAIAGQVRSGQLTPELLGDPMTWKAAAALIRITRGEDDKIVAPKRQGMAPTDLGSPNRTRAAMPDDDDITLSAEDRQWMRDNGLDEKTVMDGYRRGQKMYAEGKLK